MTHPCVEVEWPSFQIKWMQINQTVAWMFPSVMANRSPTKLHSHRTGIEALCALDTAEPDEDVVTER